MNVAVNGIDLHYDISGEGEPLLWLHGFMGAGTDWNYIFNEPPTGFRVIAPDLRGHGASTNPSSEFTFRQSADDILQLLDGLKITRIRALGVSGGGITLLHMATIRPTLIDAMVLVSAPPYYPAQARAIQRQASESMFGANELDLMRKRHKCGEVQLQELLAHARAFADSYDDVNFTPPLLGTITARTLIVFGDRDPLYPVSLAFELHAGIPDSHLWVVPNGGHGPVFGDAAPRFRETALSFLRGEWLSFRPSESAAGDVSADVRPGDENGVRRKPVMNHSSLG
jgi:pimeloyl-ACP methyl ester carboxylesterase